MRQSWRLTGICVVVFVVIVGGAVAIRSTQDSAQLTTVAGRLPGAGTSAPAPSPSSTFVNHDNAGPLTMYAGTALQGRNVDCDALYYISRTPAEGQQIAASTWGPDGMVLQSSAVPVNELVTVSVGGIDATHYPTDVSIEPVRTTPDFHENGFNLIDHDALCSERGATTGLASASSYVPFLIARFDGAKVGLTNRGNVVFDDRVPDHFGVAPFSCGTEIQDWDLHLKWVNGNTHGETVLGPFRTVPEQNLPQYLLTSGKPPGGQLTLTQVTGDQAVSPCATAPAADPLHPDAFPHCGTIPGLRNSQLPVMVLKGAITCAAARTVATNYLHDPTYTTSGTGHFVTVGPWSCGTAPLQLVLAGGVGGRCESSAGIVEIDNP